MTIISNKVFGGAIPRIPNDKLPENNAQLAVNCNFAYGELRPLRDPFLLTTLANSPKSIFSTDGLRFYSWPWRTKAWKGPVINDSFYRMYFTGQSGDLRVAQTTGMQINGGEPGTSYNVGVPSVAAAPTYQFVDRTTYPDYPSVSVSAWYFYQLEGKQYGRTAITSYTEVAPLKEWNFSVPDPVYATDTTTGIPQNATLAVTIEVKDTAKNEVIFSLTTSVTDASARSDGVPGGVEAVLTAGANASGATPYTLSLKYGVIETRSYVVTMVNQWNEESKPSPFVIVQPNYMQDVRLQFTKPSDTGYVPITKYRLYRSASNGEYLAVGSVGTLTANPMTVTDNLVNITDTDAVLESVGWDLPPAGMKGLTLMPNGFFAGFVGDTLYFSEPYRPWAWPYSMSFPFSLVGMRAVENSLVVTTTTYPYMVNGVHPSAMNQAQLTQSQTGISDHGMTVIGNTVSYLSNDGLVGVKGYEVDFSSGQAFWTRELWKSTFDGYLDEMQLAYHDGSLVCGSPTGGKMWEIRLDSEGGGNLTFRDTSTYADALYVLPQSDQLYEVRGNQLYQHNAANTYQTYDWWSKDHFVEKPKVFTAGFIRVNGSVTLTVYANGQVHHTETFTGPTWFRMPTGKRSQRWSYRLTGTGTVKEVSLAERREELARV